MRQFQTPSSGSGVQTGLPKGERTKLIIFTLGLVVIVAALWTSMSKSRSYRDEARQNLPDSGLVELEERPYRPDIDVDRISSLVRDVEPTDRVVLEREGVAALMEHARRMTEGSYLAMGAPELDAERIRAILDDPNAHRARPFFARGWIDGLREHRRGPTKRLEYSGRLVLEDDSVAYFATLATPEGAIEGDFVRLDGFFLKVFSDESSEERGRWLEGPLLVGARAVRSYPSFGKVATLDRSRLSGVMDDSVQSGISLMPFDAFWHLMAHARDLPGDAIDWEDAPELDNAAIKAVLEDGQPYRARPFRIPVSRLQSISVMRSGENPARIERYTEGWIGNSTWKNVIHYKAPFEYDDLRMTDLVSARGFFFKNLAYEPKMGGLHVAPVFVLHSLDPYAPPFDPTYRFFAYMIAGLFLALLVLFSFLLTRDKRRSLALQEKLVQRRRARRQAPA